MQSRTVLSFYIIELYKSKPNVYRHKFVYILSQTYNATLFLFDYFHANAHALSNLFHSIKSSFNQASNHVLVLTVCLKLDKNSKFIDEGWLEKMKCMVMFQYGHVFSAHRPTIRVWGLTHFSFLCLLPMAWDPKSSFGQSE